jgi:O-succinylbenzoate synthase
MRDDARDSRLPLSSSSRLTLPMRIDRIELFHVAMPLISPWRTAYGEDAACHSVLCRISSGSLDAWGESAPLAAPCYSPEWAGGIFAVVREWLAPALIGREIASGNELQQTLAVYKGNPFAKAVLDVAWWNLEARRQSAPLHRVLGATRDVVPVGADFGVMDSIDELLERIASAVAAKFPRIKLKFRPGWELEMLRAVRHAFPSETFHIDCNSGYRIEQLPLFREVDELRLAMIEQPLAHDDLVDHARLQQSLATPVCLDESVISPRHAAQAVALGSCRYINVKPGRVGGLTNALKIHDLCQAAQVPCWVGGMLESATGAGICTALAMLDNFVYPADIFPSDRFYHQDLAAQPLELTRLSDGTPAVRAFDSIPEPDPRRLEGLTVQQACLTG